MNKFNTWILLMLLSVLPLSGCTVVSLVDTAASTAIGATKLVVKGTVAAVDAVIPDGDDEDEE